ncbi:MAG: hypothetical protein AMS24_04810 [Chlamydiae bacterium SM23_39]|nr:MAG: hypothetical protein AMS24_04810 [Chlamydiae bacterium SM23_39]
MIDRPIEPPENIPKQPIEQKTPPPPPESFPEAPTSKIHNFKQYLIDKYKFSEHEANLFIQRMTQFVADQMRKEFAKMNKSIKDAFKEEDQ